MPHQDGFIDCVGYRGGIVSIHQDDPVRRAVASPKRLLGRRESLRLSYVALVVRTAETSA